MGLEVEPQNIVSLIAVTSLLVVSCSVAQVASQVLVSEHIVWL